MTYYRSLITLFLLLAAFVITSCSEDDEPVSERGRLIAAAGQDQTVVVHTEILLDGSSSFSEDDKAFTFNWLVKSKPQGSLATPGSPAANKTAFTPDVAGVYIIELQLRQEGRTAVDQVIITATSEQPNEPQTVILNQDVTSATILEDIFTDETVPDYIVTSDINVRADLTIRPGVVIFFADHRAMHIVEGKFKAIGTASQTITLRGYGTTPAYWRGLVIHSNHEENELDYVSVVGAGSMAVNGSHVIASVFLDGTPATGAALKISNTTISQGGGFGLFVSGMSSLVGFSNNSFRQNAYAAAYIPARLLHHADETTDFSGNGFDGIETYGILDSETVSHWKKLANASYLVSNHLSINSGLVIEPGAAFRIKSHVTIDVTGEGYLNATGLPNEKITFTSFAANEYWNGLLFNTASESNILDYAEVSNAGHEIIGAASHQSNVVLGPAGKVSITYSTIRNGLGYGVVAISKEQVNTDIMPSNEFYNLAKGSVYPKVIQYPDMPSLKGEWLDQWSFRNGRTSVSQDFYVQQSGAWFGGASGPWTMSTGKGLGIVVHEDGSFIWAAAEATPWTGCENYNAEFMTGTVTWNEETIVFNQSYWRSKFVNSCDPTQNADLEIETGEIALRYEINRMYDMLTGEGYWELKFFNLDQSTFSYYRR